MGKTKKHTFIKSNISLLVYPLPQGTFSGHINGDHNHVSRYKSYSYGN